MRYNLLAKTGLYLSELCLGTMSFGGPFVTSIIIGAKKKEQLVDNLAAKELTPSREQVELLDEASALPPES